jgi:serine/threonine protein phosphatase PrpC
MTPWGSTNMVPEEDINHVLQTEAEPEQACRRLVERADEAGGKDNITVVVAHFRAPNQPEAAARNRAAVEHRMATADPVTDTVPTEADAETPSKATPVLVSSAAQ